MGADWDRPSTLTVLDCSRSRWPFRRAEDKLQRQLTVAEETCWRRGQLGAPNQVLDLVHPLEVTRQSECVISKASGSPAHAFKFMEPSRSSGLA